RGLGRAPDTADGAEVELRSGPHGPHLQPGRSLRAGPVHVHAGSAAVVDEFRLHDDAGGDRHRCHGAAGAATALRADTGRSLLSVGSSIRHIAVTFTPRNTS